MDYTNFSDEEFEEVKAMVYPLVKKEELITASKAFSEEIKEQINSIERACVVNGVVLTGMADRSAFDRNTLKADVDAFIEETRAAESGIRDRIKGLLTTGRDKIPSLLQSIEENLMLMCREKHRFKMELDQLRSKINTNLGDDVSGKSAEEILTLLEAAEVELAFMIAAGDDEEISDVEKEKEKEIQEGKIIASSIIKVESHLDFLKTRDEQMVKEIAARREAIAEATNLLSDVERLDSALVSLRLSISVLEKRFVKGMSRIAGQISKGSSKLQELIAKFRSHVMCAEETQLELDSMKIQAWGEIDNVVGLLGKCVMCKTEKDVKILFFMCSSAGISKTYVVVRDSPAAKVAQGLDVHVDIIEGEEKQEQEEEERRMKERRMKEEAERREEERIRDAYRDHEFDHHLARKKV